MQSVRPLNILLRSGLKSTIRRNYGNGGFKRATMNEMPIPDGDFFAQYAKTQARYNKILALGAASCGLALFLVSSTDIVRLHPSPPKTYE